MDCRDCGSTDAEEVGLCLACVDRRLRAPDPLWGRFWEKVEKTPECWLWTAGVLPTGRGLFQVGRRVLPAPRVAWQMVYGVVPPVVLPECQEVLCVRPSHLRGFTRKNAAAWLMAHGTPVGRSTLTAKQVRRAREAWDGGNGVPIADLADRYCVHPNTMSRALRGVTWKHVTP